MPTPLTLPLADQDDNGRRAQPKMKNIKVKYVESFHGSKPVTLNFGRWGTTTFVEWL